MPTEQKNMVINKTAYYTHFSRIRSNHITANQTRSVEFKAGEESEGRKDHWARLILFRQNKEEGG